MDSESTTRILSTLRDAENDLSAEELVERTSTNKGNVVQQLERLVEDGVVCVRRHIRGTKMYEEVR